VGKVASQATGNTGNPMAGSTLQHTCRVEEEKAVRAVRDREDGTRWDGGSVSSEASGSDVRAGVVSSAAHTAEGRSLRIPGEAFSAGSQGSS